MLPNCTDNNSNELRCDQCNQLSKRYLELKEKFGRGNPVQISKEDSSEKIGYIGNIGNTKAENIDSEKGIGNNYGNILVTNVEEASETAAVDLNDAELNELQPSADSETTTVTSNQTTLTTERKDETCDMSPSPQDNNSMGNGKDKEPIEISPWTRRFIDQKLAKYGRSDLASGRRGGSCCHAEGR